MLIKFPCPRCNQYLQQTEHGIHDLTCPNFEQTCKYSNFGCSYKGCGMSLFNHTIECPHRSMVIKINNLQKELDEEKERTNQLLQEIEFLEQELKELADKSVA